MTHGHLINHFKNAKGYHMHWDHADIAGDNKLYENFIFRSIKDNSEELFFTSICLEISIQES
jgi:hypothetical protein